MKSQVVRFILIVLIGCKLPSKPDLPNKREPIIGQSSLLIEGKQQIFNYWVFDSTYINYNSCLITWDTISVLSTRKYKLLEDTIMVVEGVPVYLFPEKAAKFGTGQELESFVDSLLVVNGSIEPNVEWNYRIGAIIDSNGTMFQHGIIWGRQLIYLRATQNILQQFPKWIPAKHHGKPVNSFIHFKIKFKVV